MQCVKLDEYSLTFCKCFYYVSIKYKLHELIIIIKNIMF